MRSGEWDGNDNKYLPLSSGSAHSLFNGNTGRDIFDWIPMREITSVDEICKPYDEKLKAVLVVCAYRITDA